MSLLLACPGVETAKQFEAAVNEALRPLTLSAQRQRIISWLARWTTIRDDQAGMLFAKLRLELEPRRNVDELMSVIYKLGGTNIAPCIIKRIQEVAPDVDPKDPDYGTISPALLGGQQGRMSAIILDCLERIPSQRHKGDWDM
eukprot:Gregarina_sp_Poly_1__6537@NODE_3500_length_1051_cov_112_489837_g1800_i2_p2_GENE_NODE_3500_length_1051_cov_112_489837_g1800_i2NODE_3500_length_1051_cov_112_489837_g1800_i2_p2_ORF_typecomplete_len143_score20_01DUF3168/PF11367_8/0_083_NODE_3500_length_1051_cov_112_489837_g1800_i2108536